MNNSVDAIFEAAMALPETERFALASRLFESVPDESAFSLSDAALIQELEDRFASLDGGIPWSELRAES